MTATLDGGGGVAEELRTDDGVLDVSKFSKGRYKIQPMTMTDPPLPLGITFDVNIPKDTRIGGYTHEVTNPAFVAFYLCFAYF